MEFTMSDSPDNTTSNNHPFVLKVGYSFSSPFIRFFDTKSDAIDLLDDIERAINDGKRFLAIDDMVGISLESIAWVRITEKGTTMSDLKWLG